MRKGLFAALVMVLAASLTFGFEGAASAAPKRIKAEAIGMNAPIRKVGKKGNGLAIGQSMTAVYTWKKGDPLCDPTGTSVLAGHAWRAGDGVADKWNKLKRGNIIRVSGCRFKVTSVKYISAKRKIGHLYRVDGPPRIALIGCKPDDYSKRVLVKAKMID